MQSKSDGFRNAALGLAVLGWTAALCSGCQTGPQSVSPPPPVLPQNTTVALQPGDLPAEGLRFGLVPYLPEQLLLNAYQPMANDIGQQLSSTIRLTVAPTYAELIDSVVNGQVDLALMSPLAYVLARQRSPRLQLLLSMIRRGRTEYGAYIVVHNDSPLRTLAQLRGATFVFVDPESASGYLFPYTTLLDKGIDPETFFGKVVRRAGNHVEALRLVVERQADAAATYSGALEVAREQGLDVGVLRILSKTGRIPYDVLVAGAHVSARLGRRVAEVVARLSSRDEYARKVLPQRPLDINGWIAADDRQFDDVRRRLAKIRAHQPPPATPRISPELAP